MEKPRRDRNGTVSSGFLFLIELKENKKESKEKMEGYGELFSTVIILAEFSGIVLNKLQSICESFVNVSFDIQCSNCIADTQHHDTYICKDGPPHSDNA